MIKYPPRAGIFIDKNKSMVYDYIIKTMGGERYVEHGWVLDYRDVEPIPAAV